jgi:transposase-like protein
MPLDYAQASRAQIVREIRKGKISIAAASRRYGVPISGICGWLKLAGVPIPEEYSRPRRERSEAPLSAAAMGRRSETDR